MCKLPAWNRTLSKGDNKLELRFKRWLKLYNGNTFCKASNNESKTN